MTRSTWYDSFFCPRSPDRLTGISSLDEPHLRPICIITMYVRSKVSAIDGVKQLHSPFFMAGMSLRTLSAQRQRQPIRSNPNGTSAEIYKSILTVKLTKIFKEDLHRIKIKRSCCQISLGKCVTYFEYHAFRFASKGRCCA